MLLNKKVVMLFKTNNCYWYFIHCECSFKHLFLFLNKSRTTKHWKLSAVYYIVFVCLILMCRALEQDLIESRLRRPSCCKSLSEGVCMISSAVTLHTQGRHVLHYCVYLLKAHYSLRKALCSGYGESTGPVLSGSGASLLLCCGLVQELGVTGCGECESARFVGGWVWTSCQNNHIHYIFHKRSLPHPRLWLVILSYPPKGSGNPTNSAKDTFYFAVCTKASMTKECISAHFFSDVGSGWIVFIHFFKKKSLCWSITSHDPRITTLQAKKVFWKPDKYTKTVCLTALMRERATIPWS